MKLNEWLTANRITRSDFARQTGISRSYLQNIATEKKIPGKRIATIIFNHTNGEVLPTDMGMGNFCTTKPSHKTVVVDMVVL